MFVHLHVHSQYSFLDGASTIAQYLEKAFELGMPALALTDHHNVSGAVEFQKTAQELGIKPIQGVEVTTEEGFHLTLIAQNKQGYQTICQLLTIGYAHTVHKEPRLPWDAFLSYHDGLIVLSGCRRSAICQAILKKDYAKALKETQRLIQVFGPENVYLEMINSFLPKNKQLMRAIGELHEQTKLPIVATNNVHYIDKQTFPVHDLLTCSRTKTKLEDIHPERPLNKENYFATQEEMKERFKEYPKALHNTLAIAERCEVALKLGENLFPKYVPENSQESSVECLSRLTWEGANRRYGKITPKIAARISHELDIIAKLKVADYFLVVWDIVNFARKEGIRYSGRGSAADSAVVYCLGITNVDAIKRGLLFERFLSLERAQKPDIDIDFDARYRDDIADYVYKKYGKNQVASVCTFSTYYARSALRDFAKAFGYSQEEIGRLTKNIPGVPADALDDVLHRLPELASHPLHLGKYKELITYAKAIAGFPRHMGTHLGGLVISGVPLTAITPLQPSAKGVLITQFDKDTIEDLGLIKIDLLSLRTLSAVSEVDKHLEKQGKSYDTIPNDDQKVYKLLRTGGSVGVFQLESPAQRALQSRLQSDRMEDLVASVALIRPGPIKGDMVEPFIARRNGLEVPEYIHPKLKPILEKTYGVVLYQEQVIEIASQIAGFTPGESDRLRKVMTKFRSQEEMNKIGEYFISKAEANGISLEVAKTIFSYIVGYAGYGFCEAHAAAFADTAYKTAYLLSHYPAQFYAALLNQQPMGFYPPNTIVNEARNKGISVLPLDISQSGRDCVADNHWMRIGLKQVKGMEKRYIDSILKARTERPFESLADFVFRTDVSRDVTENLVLGGAFDRLSPNRKALLWKIADYYHYKHSCLPLEEPPNNSIPDFSPWERWIREYNVLNLVAASHILEFYRPDLTKRGILTSKQVREKKEGKVTIAGYVIRPHRPPTKSGKTIVFLTLEDEYGLIDVTVFENIYRKWGKAIYTNPLLLITGQISRRDPNQITSINAESIIALV